MDTEKVSTRWFKLSQPKAKRFDNAKAYGKANLLLDTLADTLP